MVFDEITPDFWSQLMREYPVRPSSSVINVFCRKTTNTGDPIQIGRSTGDSTGDHGGANSSRTRVTLTACTEREATPTGQPPISQPFFTSLPIAPSSAMSSENVRACYARLMSRNFTDPVETKLTLMGQLPVGYVLHSRRQFFHGSVNMLPS